MRERKPPLIDNFETKNPAPRFYLAVGGGWNQNPGGWFDSAGRVYGPNCMKSAPYAANLMKSSEFANEHVVSEVVLTAVNCYDVYKFIEWCANAIAKKIRRGVVPEPEILENSCTVKNIAREAAKLCRNRGEEIPARLEGATGKEIRRRIASYILDYANAAV